MAGTPRFLGAALAAVTLSVGASACGGGGRSHAAEPFRGGTIVGTPRAPGFALTDQSGRVVRLDSYPGKLRIVTFLYVHCPDVCPLIASHLNQALRQLGPQRDRVRVLAVSVDPRGDTPGAVRQFVAARRLLPQFHYLRGTARQLRPVWAAYNIAADPDRRDRAITHSAFEILVDGSGRERLFYDAQVKPKTLVHDLQLLLSA
jgi:protein SCO1